MKENQLWIVNLLKFIKSFKPSFGQKFHKTIKFGTFFPIFVLLFVMIILRTFKITYMYFYYKNP